MHYLSVDSEGLPYSSSCIADCQGGSVSLADFTVDTAVSRVPRDVCKVKVYLGRSVRSCACIQIKQLHSSCWSRTI
jgi:hypothetical protein